jgi:preprotein translocase subunit SecG
LISYTMNILFSILFAVQILSALVMIGLILMQHGKGADAGAAFGGGASTSLFGASGGANFLSRSTAVMATVFLISTLVLAYVGGQARPSAAAGSVLETATPALEVPAPTAPVAPAPAQKGAGAIPAN